MADLGHERDGADQRDTPQCLERVHRRCEIPFRQNASMCPVRRSRRSVRSAASLERRFDARDLRPVATPHRQGLGPLVDTSTAQYEGCYELSPMLRIPCRAFAGTDQITHRSPDTGHPVDLSCLALRRERGSAMVRPRSIRSRRPAAAYRDRILLVRPIADRKVTPPGKLLQEFVDAARGILECALITMLGISGRNREFVLGHINSNVDRWSCCGHLCLHREKDGTYRPAIRARDESSSADR